MKKFIYLAMLLVFASFVHGLAIAPAYYEVNYLPGSKQHLEFRIINNDGSDIDTSFYVDDENRNYIELESKGMFIEESSPEKKVSYVFRAPENLPPGRHDFEITVFASKEPPSGAGTVLQGSVALKHKIKVDVPYPDKHLTTQFYVAEEKDHSINFRIALTNTGKQPLGKISAKILIYDENNAAIETLSTTEASLQPGEKGKLVSVLNKGLSPGSYKAEAIIDYDSQIEKLTKEFQTGEALVNIEDLGVNNFRLGTIAKLDMHIKNYWNSEIKGIEPTLVITNTENDVLAEYEAKPVDIPAESTLLVPAFWDTKNIDAGEYIASAKVKYLGRINEQVYRLIVGIDKIIVRQESEVTGQVAGGEVESPERYFIILLVAFSVPAIIFAFRKFKGGRKGSKAKQLIRNSLQKGMSVTEIRQNLIDAGYNAEKVAQLIIEVEEELSRKR